MPKYTVDQYRKLAQRFNAKPFKEQIETLRDHPEVARLCCDGNWWKVKVTNIEAQEQLEEEGSDMILNMHRNGTFEMDAHEILDLLKIIGIGVFDL